MIDPREKIVLDSYRSSSNDSSLFLSKAVAFLAQYWGGELIDWLLFLLLVAGWQNWRLIISEIDH